MAKYSLLHTLPYFVGKQYRSTASILPMQPLVTLAPQWWTLIGLLLGAATSLILSIANDKRKANRDAVDKWVLQVQTLSADFAETSTEIYRAISLARRSVKQYLQTNAEHGVSRSDKAKYVNEQSEGFEPLLLKAFNLWSRLDILRADSIAASALVLWDHLNKARIDMDSDDFDDFSLELRSKTGDFIRASKRLVPDKVIKRATKS